MGSNPRRSYRYESNYVRPTALVQTPNTLLLRNMLSIKKEESKQERRGQGDRVLQFVTEDN
jgi:hypothetical protein